MSSKRKGYYLQSVDVSNEIRIKCETLRLVDLPLSPEVYYPFRELGTNREFDMKGKFFHKEESTIRFKSIGIGIGYEIRDFSIICDLMLFDGTRYHVMTDVNFGMEGGPFKDDFIFDRIREPLEVVITLGAFQQIDKDYESIGYEVYKYLHKVFNGKL